MPFSHERVVRFSDTDAAGVVYFAQVLAMCHEAYEASLAAAGIELHQFFRGSELAIPIVHASIDFFAPMYCGDRLEICLTPQRLTAMATPPVASSFEIVYTIAGDRSEKGLSRAYTRHVCIDPATRQWRELPEDLYHWLEKWA
jgi:1,4-dihydroxy-2-naphthoyl-CoA hydrolase